MNLNEIKKHIEENPHTTISELFGKYQLDFDSIVISSILLDLDYKDLVDEFKRRLRDEIDVVEKIEGLINEDRLFSILFPKNVQIAFLILIYLPQFKEKSSQIVVDLINNESYLSQIKDQNIFDNNDIVFFSIQEDLKENVLESIKDKLLKLEVAFIEPAFKEFWSHFRLNHFLEWDEVSSEEFFSTIKKHRNEIQNPTLVHQKAFIEKDKVKICFDNSYLNHSLLGLSHSIDFSKVLGNFIKMFTEDVKDELVESGVKYLITSAWGFGYLDFTVKGVKNFVLALHSVSSPLSRDKVLEDFSKFQLSGKNSVKEWFLNEKKNELMLALESSNLNIDSITIDQKMFESYYVKFIERYFVLYGLSDNLKEVPENHTEIFTSVYDRYFNYNLRLNSSF